MTLFSAGYDGHCPQNMACRGGENCEKAAKAKAGMALGKHEGLPGTVCAEPGWNRGLQRDAADGSLCVTEHH